MSKNEDEATAWATEQMQGVVDPSRRGYHLEWQFMMLIYYDCMAMQSADEGVTYFHWASDFEPRSWAWLL